MTELPADPMTLHTPRWLNSVVATIADVVLLLITVAIITAMWLPAYLTSRQPANAVDHSHDDLLGMYPRSR